MTQQTKKPESIFPDYPREQKIVDSQGNINPLFDLGLGSMFQALQENFSNEGILFPALTQTEITTIENIYAPYIGKPLPQDDPTNAKQINIPDISGKTVFDSTNRVPKQFIIKYNATTPPTIQSAKWYTFTLT
jgi:hypothetical protein